MSNMNKKKKGFTLVEVMLAVVLIGIVITLAAPMIIGILNGQRASYAEYDVQSTLRNASMRVNDTINESFAIFTIPADDFEKLDVNSGANKPAFKDSEPWDYFGVSADGKQLVSYIYKGGISGGEGTHERVVLAESGEGYHFNLNFYKPTTANNNLKMAKFIGYTIELVRDGETDGFTISTELEAKNSNQVVFRTSDYKPAAAIAVRRIGSFDEGESNHVTFVHFVLDLSRSMNLNLQGGGTIFSTNAVNDIPNSRIYMLKRALESVVNEFIKEKNVEFVFYPFNSSANWNGKSHNIYKKEDEAKDNVDNYDTYSGHTIFSKNFPKTAGKNYLQSEENLYDGKKSCTLISKYAENGANTSINTYINAAIKIDGYGDYADSVGGTNLGDALRRVYYKVKLIDSIYMTDSDFYDGAYTHSHYVIILSDGVPTLRTTELESKFTSEKFWFFGWRWRWRWVSDTRSNFLTDGNVYHQKKLLSNVEAAPNVTKIDYEWEWYGDGSDALNYVKTFANKLKDITSATGEKGKNVRKSFIIGFSSVPEDLDKIDKIAGYLGIPNPDTNKEQIIKFTDAATVSAGLTKIFSDIKAQIMLDESMLTGPSMNK